MKTYIFGLLLTLLLLTGCKRNTDFLGSWKYTYPNEWWVRTVMIDKGADGKHFNVTTNFLYRGHEIQGYPSTHDCIYEDNYCFVDNTSKSVCCFDENYKTIKMEIDLGEGFINPNHFGDAGKKETIVFKKISDISDKDVPKSETTKSEKANVKSISYHYNEEDSKIIGFLDKNKGIGYYQITLQQPITVSPIKNTNDPDDDPIEDNIKVVQLAFDQNKIDLDKYLNAKVEIMGSFFHADGSPNHYEAVLMMVKEIHKM